MKTLIEKLRYRTGEGTQVWRCPDAIRSHLMPIIDNQSDTASFRIGFARNRADLSLLAEELASSYARGGHLWICYPKKSGAIASDLTRDIGWEPIDALGLFAVTQVAIDENWSALRFRKRDEIASFTRKT